jgi:hypothetical protein
MNEIRRMAYLEAMGVDAYVSRQQLPGAAPTRRLAIVPSVPRAIPPVADNPAPVASIIAPPRSAPPVPQLDIAPQSSEPAPVGAATPRQDTVSRFSLVAIAAGDWLWLEELEGMPLTTDQVQLVQAMARALQTALAGAQPEIADPPEPARARPEVNQFDWPIHTNQQLDLGNEAARSSVAGFIARKLEQQQCKGLVVLGGACKERIALEQLDYVQVVCTAASRQILQDAQLKQQVWRDLRSLVTST